MGIPAASFFKDLKYHLVRAKLTDVEKTGRLNHARRETITFVALNAI